MTKEQEPKLKPGDKVLVYGKYIEEIIESATILAKGYYRLKRWPYTVVFEGDLTPIKKAR